MITTAFLMSLTAIGDIKTIRRANDITSVRYADASSQGVPFDIKAKVVYLRNTTNHPHGSFIVKDDSGAAILQNYLVQSNSTVRVGDIVRATGKIYALNNGIYAHCKNISVFSHSKPGPPVSATIDEFFNGSLDGTLATVRGVVSDVLPDEIDDGFIFFILKDGNKSIYISAEANISDCITPESLIGNTVDITGICIHGNNNGMRRHIGRIIQLWDANSIHIVNRANKDIFDAPDLGNELLLTPNEMPFLERRTITGTVIASWHDNQIMIKTDDKNLVRLIGISSTAPEIGKRITAVGFPETDLYSVNLNNVRWRYASGTPLLPDPPMRLTSRKLRNKHIPLRHIQARLHGKSVQAEGIVRGLPLGESDGRMILECEGCLLSVDCSACPDALEKLAIGCTIDVTGIWITETENWRPNSVFPRIKTAFVVVNSTDAIRVISYPSWWTTGRCLTLIGILLTLLACVIAWNRTLKAIAERRKRELRDEIVSHISSDLRLSERTSLAVELHDTIAQTLTGVALELRTANNLLSNNLEGVRFHLDAAAKTLTFCRKELKNCLFDLRSDTLGQRDMEAFIRQAVSPIIGQAKLAIRFNVPRERIYDTSAHAIVRIIRELVSNAVNHGKAQTIRIAGAIENNSLFFSVSDDGCGFDIAHAPGVEECHFGFQGIRERVAKFHGDMKIESDLGKGTRISISMNLSSQCHTF